MQVSDVILLGAGASKSEGAPLQKELFMSFFDYINYIRSFKFEDYSTEETRIKDYFSKFWGINVEDQSLENDDFPTFEECLGMLDLATLQNESFKGYNKDTIQELRNSLIFLIAKILDEKLLGQAEYHNDLVARLIRNRKLKNTAFITLNYDILIDNALIEQYDSYHIDYGIELINYRRKDDFERPTRNKSVYLLKIHGSLNLLYCPTCIHVERTRYKATEAFYKSKPCDDCGTRMEPIIIPPTFYKEMTNLFIRQVYKKADEIIRQAKRIYICGYSFPDADLHVKYLFKRSETFNNKTPEIYVINRDNSDHFKKLYLRIFKEKSKVKFPGISFEEFCRNGIT